MGLGDALQFGMDTLDTPGRLLRTLLAGGDPGAALFDPEQGKSGRDVLEHLGLLDHKEEGAGFDGGDLAGMAAGVALDPLTWMSGGLGYAGIKKIGSMMKAGEEAAQAAKLAAYTPSLAHINFADGVNPEQLQGAYKTLQDTNRSDLLRLLTDVKPISEAGYRDALTKLNSSPDTVAKLGGEQTMDTIKNFANAALGHRTTADPFTLRIPPAGSGTWNEVMDPERLAHELRHAEQKVLQPSWFDQSRQMDYAHAPHEIDAKNFASELSGTGRKFFARGPDALDFHLAETLGKNEMPKGGWASDDLIQHWLGGEKPVGEPGMTAEARAALDSHLDLNSMANRVEHTRSGHVNVDALNPSQRLETILDDQASVIPEFGRNVLKARDIYGDKLPPWFPSEDPLDQQLSRYSDWIKSNALARDEAGNPLVVHHGTGSRFALHDESKFGSGAGGNYRGKGVYDTADYKLAKNYRDSLTNSFGSARQQARQSIEDDIFKNGVTPKDFEKYFVSDSQRYSSNQMSYSDHNGLTHTINFDKKPVMDAGGDWHFESNLRKSDIPAAHRSEYFLDPHEASFNQFDPSDDPEDLVNHAVGTKWYKEAPVHLRMPIKDSAFDDEIKRLGLSSQTGDLREEHVIGNKLLDLKQAANRHDARNIINSALNTEGSTGGSDFDILQKWDRMLSRNPTEENPFGSGHTLESIFGRAINVNPDINKNLQAIGYDALRHQGGMAAGGGKRLHDVYVTFDPKNVVPANPTLEQLGMLRALHSKGGAVPFSLALALGLGAGSQGEGDRR